MVRSEPFREGLTATLRLTDFKNSSAVGLSLVPLFLAPCPNLCAHPFQPRGAQAPRHCQLTASLARTDVVLVNPRTVRLSRRVADYSLRDSRNGLLLPPTARPSRQGSPDFAGEVREAMNKIASRLRPHAPLALAGRDACEGLAVAALPVRGTVADSSAVPVAHESVIGD